MRSRAGGLLKRVELRGCTGARIWTRALLDPRLLSCDGDADLAKNTARATPRRNSASATKIVFEFIRHILIICERRISDKFFPPWKW